jgi:hypothetical protein
MLVMNVRKMGTLVCWEHSGAHAYGARRLLVECVSVLVMPVVAVLETVLSGAKVNSCSCRS